MPILAGVAQGLGVVEGRRKSLSIFFSKNEMQKRRGFSNVPFPFSIKRGLRNSDDERMR